MNGIRFSSLSILPTPQTLSCSLFYSIICECENATSLISIFVDPKNKRRFSSCMLYTNIHRIEPFTHSLIHFIRIYIYFGSHACMLQSLHTRPRTGSTFLLYSYYFSCVSRICMHVVCCCCYWQWFTLRTWAFRPKYTRPND